MEISTLWLDPMLKIDLDASAEGFDLRAFLAGRPTIFALAQRGAATHVSLARGSAKARTAPSSKAKGGAKPAASKAAVPVAPKVKGAKPAASKVSAPAASRSLSPGAGGGDAPSTAFEEILAHELAAYIQGEGGVSSLVALGPEYQRLKAAIMEDEDEDGEGEVKLKLKPFLASRPDVLVLAKRSVKLLAHGERQPQAHDAPGAASVRPGAGRPGGAPRGKAATSRGGAEAPLDAPASVAPSSESPVEATADEGAERAAAARGGGGEAAVPPEVRLSRDLVALIQQSGGSVSLAALGPAFRVLKAKKGSKVTGKLAPFLQKHPDVFRLVEGGRPGGATVALLPSPAASEGSRGTAANGGAPPAAPLPSPAAGGVPLKAAKVKAAGGAPPTEPAAVDASLLARTLPSGSPAPPIAAPVAHPAWPLGSGAAAAVAPLSSTASTAAGCSKQESAAVSGASGEKGGAAAGPPHTKPLAAAAAGAATPARISSPPAGRAVAAAPPASPPATVPNNGAQGVGPAPPLDEAAWVGERLSVALALRVQGAGGEVPLAVLARDFGPLKAFLGAAEGEELLPFLQRRPDLFRLVGRGDACTVALRGVAATWP